ncbi:MAG: M24 family metallopeptidase, partial [Chloroflexi bacterium]|nr:M24 family metallopeptidase [Chloroflexota bacterium]
GTFWGGAARAPPGPVGPPPRLAFSGACGPARPGGFLGDIGAAIEDVALAHGYGVVRSFVGHGIGTEMHEEPQVANYRTGNRGRRIEPGLCLAIEPMFTLGSYEVRVKADGWTVETFDGSMACHWEHSIAITDSGPRILTVNDPAQTAGLPVSAAGNAT